MILCNDRRRTTRQSLWLTKYARLVRHHSLPLLLIHRDSSRFSTTTTPQNGLAMLYTPAVCRGLQDAAEERLDRKYASTSIFALIYTDRTFGSGMCAFHGLVPVYHQLLNPTKISKNNVSE